MNARASTSNPPPKFTKPLDPPSGSSRSQSFASSPARTFRDSAPPAKRRRLTSTPTSSSLSLSTPRSSSSRPEQSTLADIHDARAASSMRVLNIWSTLAERYNRRLDEDDIVDIRTGQVIKDRGVLSELPKRYNFGDLADKDDDHAASTDPGTEAVDNHAEEEEEEDDDDEDEDDGEEARAFSPSDGLVASTLARLAPLRPAASSSDADDLRQFLEAEAIRRQLDGDDDDSSEDEINILPPRSSPAKRTITPAREAVRAKSQFPAAPDHDTESEDEFAVYELERNEAHRGYRARRAPSPEVELSMPSPPPLSSSPGPSSSLSLHSSPLLPRTSLDSIRGLQTEQRFGSPTPKRQPRASTSRRTLEETLDEIDLEFPPPPPRAPSVFAKRPNSPFVTDLSLSDDETEDKQPEPPSNVTKSPKSGALKSGTGKKCGSLAPKRLIPYVLIETKRPTPTRTTATISESTSATTDPDPATLPKRGGPRTKSSKDKPPDVDCSKNQNTRDGSEGGRDVVPNASTSLTMGETPVSKGTPKKVKSPSLFPARSDSSPKVNQRPKPRPKGKIPHPASPDDGSGPNSEASPTGQTTASQPSPVQVTTPKPGLKPGCTRGPVTKPKSARSARFTGSGASTTLQPKSKATRKSPEIASDVEGDNPSSPSPPPSPSPAPQMRPRTRSSFKRKRRVSSGEEQGDPKANHEQRSPVHAVHGSSESQTCDETTPETIVLDTHGDDAGAGGPGPRSQSPSRPTTMMEATPAPAPTSTVNLTASSSNRRGDDTPNRFDGSHTHPPSSAPRPTGLFNQAHQPIAQHSGHTPPFRDQATSFSHTPYPYHDQHRYGHSPYHLFQDPNAQAILAQAATQLAVLMNGGRLPRLAEHVGGMSGGPGWGSAPAWPPSTPTTSPYHYGHVHQQRSFQNPYISQYQAGGGAGQPMPSPTLFPVSNTFSSPLPGSIPDTRDAGAMRERPTNAARHRSESSRRVTFASDPRPASADGPSDPVGLRQRGTEGSPPMTRGRSQRRGTVNGTPGHEQEREVQGGQT